MLSTSAPSLTAPKASHAHHGNGIHGTPSAARPAQMRLKAMTMARSRAEKWRTIAHTAAPDVSVARWMRCPIPHSHSLLERPARNQKLDASQPCLPPAKLHQKCIRLISVLPDVYMTSDDIDL